eukprot:6174031-Pleurochrysis_carterae.AAC.3
MQKVGWRHEQSFGRHRFLTIGDARRQASWQVHGGLHARWREHKNGRVGDPLAHPGVPVRAGEVGHVHGRASAYTFECAGAYSRLCAGACRRMQWRFERTIERVCRFSKL